MQVEVVRSTRRRRTVEARLVDGVLEVRIPARLSQREERRFVREMTERFERRRHTDEIDLRARTTRLARQYSLPEPTSISWSDRQRRRWGSCTVDTGAIRVSSVLAGYPGWVLDYVIVHELAHLAEPAHNADFHALVSRYPKAERAEGFLIAKGWGDEPGTTADSPGADAAAAAPEVATLGDDGPGAQGRLF
jgi:predicted metal-dependent hydrolase